MELTMYLSLLPALLLAGCDPCPSAEITGTRDGYTESETHRVSHDMFLFGGKKTETFAMHESSCAKSATCDPEDQALWDTFYLEIRSDGTATRYDGDQQEAIQWGLGLYEEDDTEHDECDLIMDEGYFDNDVFFQVYQLYWVREEDQRLNYGLLWTYDGQIEVDLPQFSDAVTDVYMRY